MCDSIPKINLIGRWLDYNIYFNPLNQRVICERANDLATVLYQLPSYEVARNWSVPTNDVKSLRIFAQHLMRDNSRDGNAKGDGDIEGAGGGGEL